MKLALDATYSLGENLSGIGVYSTEMLLGLAAAHPEATLLFCYRPHHFFRSFLRRLPRNCRRRLLVETRVPSADLFHGLNQRLPRVRLPRVVATFHDLFVLTGDYSSSDFRCRFAAQAREAADRSDLIIAVSHFTARQLEDLLAVEPARIRVIPHGVRMRPAGPAPAREKMILHVGAIQRRKNIARLVEAFERLEGDWRLALAGSVGYGGEEILRRIDASRCRARIQVLGYVDARALSELYHRSSIFAFPSLDEGFGMPVLEAMAAGVPVVTSNRSALPEVAGDAALLVDPTDVEAISEALQTLCSNEQVRSELAQKGLARASACTWDTAVQKTWAVYEELAGR